MNAECFLITIYTVQFTALHLGDGTTAKATVQVSVGLKRTSPTGPHAVPVTQPTSYVQLVIDDVVNYVGQAPSRAKSFLDNLGVPTDLNPAIYGNLVSFVIIGGVLVLLYRVSMGMG